MRAFYKMSPQYWTGQTGRAIKRAGKNCQLLGAFLCFAPQGNAIGLFYLPIDHITHEVALTPKEIREALEKLCAIGFCAYDLESEFVWVIEKAKHELGELSSGDKKVLGLNREYETIPKNPFLGSFFDRYHDYFHLQNRRDIEGAWKPLPRGIEGSNKDKDTTTYQDTTLNIPNEIERGLGRERESGTQLIPLNCEEDPSLSPGELVALYNDNRPKECPRVTTISDKRLEKAKRYLAKYPHRSFWLKVFSEMHQSQFVRGLKNGAGHEGYVGDLDWLLSVGKNGTENFVKVHDGKYRDKPAVVPVVKGWHSLRSAGEKVRQGGGQK